MHELSIAIQIMDIVGQHLPKDSDCILKKITLKVGRLSTVVPESLSFCIDAIWKDKYTSSVELEIIESPAMVQCRECESISQVEPPILNCPVCNQSNIKIVSGWEMQIESIEVTSV